MNGEKYEIGDIVECIPGFIAGKYKTEAERAGAAYVEGKVFKIVRLSRYHDKIPNNGDVYFAEEGNGIFGRALKKVDQVTNNYQIF